MTKKEKKRWLKGCSCGEKFARLARKFSGNFSGEASVDYEISVIFKLCSNGFKKISRLRIDEISVDGRFFPHMKGIVSASEGFTIVF